MTEAQDSKMRSKDGMPSVAQRILSRVEANSPSGVWSRADFLDLAGPYAVEKALQRLMLKGEIRRSLRGFYDRPSFDPVSERWKFPPVLSFVDAIARRDKLSILVDGMTAAHALGLTPSGPISTIIHANTRPRVVKIRASIGYRAGAPVIYRLAFRRTSAKTAWFWAGRPAMLIVQAFGWLRSQGYTPKAATNELLQHMKSDQDVRTIAADLRSNMAELPLWMQPFMVQIADTLHQRAETPLSDTEFSRPTPAKNRELAAT